MEPHGIAGGIDEGLTAPPFGAPPSSFPSSLPSSPRLPPDVAQVLSYLANLIDQSIALRGVGNGVRDFAAAVLGVPATRVVATTAELTTMAFQLAALAFGDDLAAHPPAAIIGEDQDTPPRWEVLNLGELRVPVPFSLAAAFPAGTMAACGLVVLLDETYEGSRQFVVTVFSRSEDAGGGKAYLDELLARSRSRTNPFKGRVLETIRDDRFGLTFRVVSLPATAREDVILPDAVWAEMDRNVHGFFRALARLKAAGLSCNRGILLEGPPGTGKTALCRAIAGELDATVVFCDAPSVSRSVTDLYRELVHLAPALVVMEDVDLVVGHRNEGGREALLNFLLALDGAVSEHEGVVTIATTNDVAGIDDAAKRSARFDRVVTVGHPDRAGRAGILGRYLRNLEAEVDVARVVAVTEGLTGADLREIVSLALLDAAGDEGAGGVGRVTTEALVRLAQEHSRARPPGQYL
jgi:cell division protease FtsH